MIRFRRDKDIPEVALTLSFQTFIRLTIFVLATVLLLNALERVSHALLLIFGGLFLALALNAPVSWLSRRIPGKRKNNRVLATSLSFLIVVLLLGAFIASIVPPLVKQTNSFIDGAPRLITDFRKQDSGTGELIRRYNLEKQVNNVSKQLSSSLDEIGSATFSTVQRVGSSVFALLTVLVLSFMMLVEGPRWLRFGRELIPDHHHELADRMAVDMYKVIKGYVNGQVLLAVMAALFIVPALFILDVSYPVALAVVVFVCGLIPMVGHTIGAIIVTVVALFTSLPTALIILGYYILYQQIENYLIQPRVQANTTNMSPLLVFMSLIIGVGFGGLVGGLVAIPVAGCIRILVLEYLRTAKIIDDATFERETTPETK